MIPSTRIPGDQHRTRVLASPCDMTATSQPERSGLPGVQIALRPWLSGTYLPSDLGETPRRDNPSHVTSPSVISRYSCTSWRFNQALFASLRSLHRRYPPANGRSAGPSEVLYVHARPQLGAASESLQACHRRFQLGCPALWTAFVPEMDASGPPSPHSGASPSVRHSELLERPPFSCVYGVRTVLLEQGFHGHHPPNLPNPQPSFSLFFPSFPLFRPKYAHTTSQDQLIPSTP